MSMADRDGFIWQDGKLVPWREATTHVLTHSLHYGLAVFEGVRAYNTVSGTAASGLSLPEACRMSDALCGQLRSRLQLDPAGTQAVARLRDLRATMERLRDQVGLEPPQTIAAAQARLAQLEGRLTMINEKAGRGGDIGGLLGPLEAEAATFERDLIVDYTDTVRGILGSLSPDNLETATVIAGLPDMIRGYEDVKLRNVQRYREQLAELQQEFAQHSHSSHTSAS